MAQFIATGRTVPAENGWKWIVEGWNLFKREAGIWIALIVIFIVISIALAFVPVLGSIASMVLGPVFIAGLVIGCRALDEGGELKIEHLFAGFRERFGTLASIGALYLAATVVIALFAGLVTGVKLFALMSGGGASDPEAVLSAAVAILLAVLIMAALMVPVFMAIWFAPPLVVFHQLGALDALKASFAGCLKNVVPFLVYGVILLVASIVASIPFGLGWLVLGPVIAASVYTAYRDIYFG
jgi:uncharacterized membrane protein